MAANTQHLRAKRCGCDVESSRLPLIPVLPVIAAAPAEHDEDSLLVGEMEEFVGLHLAFEADGIEVHVADHA